MSDLAINLDEYSADAKAEAFQHLATQRGPTAANADASHIRTPSDVMGLFGQTHDGDRDTWEVLGYDENVDETDFRTVYRRGDVGSRIVTLPPEDTWRERPAISDDGGEDASDSDESDATQTDFERAVETLADETGLFSYCQRADIAAGIGEYGVLFIGVADNQPFKEPVNTDALSEVSDLAYLTPRAQDQIEDWSLNDDETSERFGQPEYYEIDFGELDEDTTSDDLKTVHHSRVIHIAEGAVENDLKGTPRLRTVYNRLQDRQKVLGGSAEMFWSGADRKFHFDVRDGYSDLPDGGLADLSEQAEKLVHDMQPYLRTAGVDVEVLGGEDPDPSGIVEALETAIAAATGIPKRILQGSERGELASSQDRANWFDTISSRQRNYAEQTILRPLLDQLKEFGILPPPGGGSYSVEWPDLFKLTDEERSLVRLNRAKALKQAPVVDLTDKQVLAFVEDGTIPDVDESQGQLEALPRLDETNPEVREQFRESTGAGEGGEAVADGGEAE